MTHLFVYGTLRRGLGHGMHTWLAARADLVGEATVQGRLYDLGDYPGAVLSEEPTDRVVGEVYVVEPSAADDVLRRLDRYEGCDGMARALYRRARRRPRRRADGQIVEAWIYLYNRSVADHPRILSGDYVAHRQGR